MKQDKLNHSIIAILASIFVIGGTGYTFYKYQRSSVISRLTDEKHQIKRIIQTGPEKEALKTTYLAELLNLSSDKPTPFDLFQPKDAQKLLQKAPMIKWAKVRKQKPDTIYIEYEVRRPIATLADLTNTAIDEENMLFPLRPFYTPKRLPEFYLGISTPTSPLTGDHITLALEVLSLCTNFHPLRIDVSNAFNESLGRREIVLLLSHNNSVHTLRLSPQHLNSQLANYSQLTLPSGDQTIDLRLPRLAFY